MRLKLASWLGQFTPRALSNGLSGIAAQRLICGFVAGCLAAVLLNQSAILETLELSMLQWRYKVASKLSGLKAAKQISKDIVVVAFDDATQFDLGIARFNDQHSQAVLSSALNVIESSGPALVVVDLDLRGAANQDLIRQFSRYRNVVLGLFGTLEGATDLPASEFMTHAAAFGYRELLHESDGVVCRLSVNNQDKGVTSQDNGFAPIPSLTEAVVNVYRRIKGVGPARTSLTALPDQPVYINFHSQDFPKISFQKLLSANFDASVFKDKIVLVGATVTGRREDPLNFRTPLGDLTPEVQIQAVSISTLLDNVAIYSFARTIAQYGLILLGAVFGALCSFVALSLRLASVLTASLILLVVAQTCFSEMNMAMPIAAPLAMLFTDFVLGTVIHLDTDLRRRNKELAVARESMQVRAEEERQRIAEDLHDETLPALSSVARMADRLAQELKDNPLPYKMRESLDVAVSEMRRVINDLHPSVLETMGFVPALENLVSILSRDTGIEGKFIDGTGACDYNLSQFIKLQLYRIVQEALNNIQKHSQASKMELSIKRDNGTLMISVADNGRGIDAKLIKPDSHGLINIKQRAQLIGAHIDWAKPRQFKSGLELKLRISLAQDDGDG